MTRFPRRFRWPRVVTALLLFAIFGAPSIAQQQAGQPAPQDAEQTAQAAKLPLSPASTVKSEIRAITFFVDLDRADYQNQLADAFKALHMARKVFTSHGYVVQRLCVATQPFAEYTKDLSAAQALAFFQRLDALAAKEDVEISIGPALYHPRDGDAQAELLTSVLLNTKFISGSIVVADKDGLRSNASRAAARVIKKLSEGTANSEGTLRFAALAMVPPLVPAPSAAYLDGFGHQFAISLQSASLVDSVATATPKPQSLKQDLTDAFAAEAYDVDALAGRVDGETGWAYVGVDLSPWPAKDASIGEALEIISEHHVGSAEAIAAAKMISSAIYGVSLKQTGFGAVALPILEDRRLAQRWSEGRISIDTLLDYFSAGSTGLDAVPLPEDVTASQLELIIVNAASAAYHARRAMQIRLVPVAGKLAGQRTDFNDLRLVNVMLQPLNYPRAKQ